MVKSRYFYYLFLMNNLINVINFVPRELIERRFDGALISLIIAVPVGCLTVFFFSSMMNKFPGKTIPDIFHAGLPKPVSVPLLLFLLTLWYIVGLITLISFVDITLRYISPDVNPYMIMGGFLVVVLICCLFDSVSLLYGLEVILWMTVPMIVYMISKTLASPNFSWDAVFQTCTHLWNTPDLQALAAATFTFSGYANLVIYNKVLQGFRPRRVWILAVEGLIALLLTLLVPIGIHGTMAVDRHAYPWFSVADSIRIETFLIERMLYVFYLAYLVLSMVSVIIHWHVCQQLLKQVHPSMPRLSESKPRMVNGVIAGLFAGLALFGMRLDPYDANRLAEWFLNARWLGELFLLVFLYYCVRKLRRREG